MRRKSSFAADQRGAVAFEMPSVLAFMLLSLLLPLADVAIAGFKYISAWEALRAFGQTIQYTPPPDVTNAGAWETTVTGKADPSFPISNFQLICGDTSTVCSSTNTASPKYYSYSTSITLAPLILKPVLCPGGNCKITLTYTERFQ